MHVYLYNMCVLYLHYSINDHHVPSNAAAQLPSTARPIIITYGFRISASAPLASEGKEFFQNGVSTWMLSLGFAGETWKKSSYLFLACNWAAQCGTLLLHISSCMMLHKYCEF